jgi:LmbE family N-acetylglucosaminyl deacetylase
MAETRRRIVAVVAHPDDFAHSMGGTAILLSRSYDLHVICLSKGERGMKGASMAQAAAIREQEERQADALAGASVRFLGAIDGDIHAGPEQCARVAEVIREVKPVALFTLWPVNVPDHLMVYAMAIKALHLAGVFYETEVYLSENGIGGQTMQFEPDLYVDITEVVAQKRAMARCHLSQNPDEQAVERVIERNRIRGMMARCDYAEPFKTVMPLANKRWGRTAGSLLLELT